MIAVALQGNLLIALGYIALAGLVRLFFELPAPVMAIHRSCRLRRSGEWGAMDARDILLLERAQVVLNEGPHHQGPAEVVRAIVQRPAA